ncbi:MAG: septum site-determining protein MinC [Scytolyngbya sp. HA4215-MV1]|nr:septum site-determining protein MinC [Scytolyngbya sp. HA4215-MV1]
MSSDASVPASVPVVPPAPSEVDRNSQVRFKSEGGRLVLLLPPEDVGDSINPLSWTEIWQQLKQRLDGSERFWQPNTTVHLIARDRLLDSRQLQAIADALTEAQLQLKRVYTSRRQTAVAAATSGYSVEQQPTVAHLNQPTEEAGQAMAEPLYLQTTLRSGNEIRHNGTIIILGDSNPGSAIVADGDIIVWGRLRGVAQAGAKGNSRCLILALQMEPTQIRIANFVARAPENPPGQFYPEIAYATPQGIRITRASDFSRP